MSVTAEDCNKKYGNPKLEHAMILWDVPTELEIGVIPKRIYCNKDMVKPLEKAFRNLIDSGCVKELRTYDGVFHIRKTTKGTSMSLHSWGIAIDVNASSNRYGKVPTLSEDFVKCFTSAGFEWGGDWRLYKDGMHFQLASIEEKIFEPTVGTPVSLSSKYFNETLNIALEKNKIAKLAPSEIMALHIYYSLNTFDVKQRLHHEVCKDFKDILKD